jgi:ubiquinol-cytochrome c reductase iron-sulfur subunit
MSIADRLAARGNTPGDGPAVEPPDTAQHVSAPPPASPSGQTPVIDPQQARRGELIAALNFQASALSTLLFVAVYIFGDEHRAYYTPLLGTGMGLALLFIGIGAVVWAKVVMQASEAVQDRHELSDPREQAEAARAFTEGVQVSQIAQRSLLRRSFLGSQLVLGLLAIIPLRSLGPQPKKELEHTHWSKGVRLVDEFGKPIKLGDIAIGGFVTVFPATAPDGSPGWVGQAAADSVSMLIRVRPDELTDYRTTRKRSIEGHVAYSKLCTHLGCPVSLYEQQTHRLLCPCHQSQFRVTEAARPVFGPAARALPQLEIALDEDGYFIAKGDFSEPVGAGYWERD